MPPFQRFTTKPKPERGGGMATTENEDDILVALLTKVTWPPRPRVFHALVKITITIPIELAVLNERNEILMFYRKDDEYDGNHIPGTVIRDNENISCALERLRTSEIVGGNISNPIDIGHVEIMRGNDPGQNPTRHEVSLIHVAWLTSPYKGNGRFYPLDQLPENTLSHHQVIIDRVRRWLAS